MTVERVSVPVETRVPTGATNAYLIGTTNAALIDPATRTPELDAAVAQRSLDHILVTHTHPDHVGAVHAYAAESDATVWGLTGRTERFQQATGVTPDRTFREGTTIPSTPPLQVIALPGHAPDHVAFTPQTKSRSIAVIGDIAVATGSVFIGATDGDMRAYYTTLRRLLAHNYNRLYPGHGNPITDPQTRITELLAHRRYREHRIETAVRDGARTVSDILTAAYDKDLTGVEDLAAATVRAHLMKLHRERRLIWDGETAHPQRS